MEGTTKDPILVVSLSLFSGIRDLASGCTETYAAAGAEIERKLLQDIANVIADHAVADLFVVIIRLG